MIRAGGINKMEREAIKIEGIINAYSKEFFTHRDNVTEDSELEVKYIADPPIFLVGKRRERNGNVL